MSDSSPSPVNEPTAAGTPTPVEPGLAAPADATASPDASTTPPGVKVAVKDGAVVYSAPG